MSNEPKSTPSANGAEPIYQCMATDDDENPTSVKVWMDVEKREYESLIQRPDMRARIVYQDPSSMREAYWHKVADQRAHEIVRLITGAVTIAYRWRRHANEKWQYADWDSIEQQAAAEMQSRGWDVELLTKSITQGDKA